ncbi:MAG: DUF6046 domain-containing protein [Bacteroidales bacterium]|jgi:hypothetical protein|nr:DUF6046 domain-containing protein [Bacteroidales bacterium]
MSLINIFVPKLAENSQLAKIGAYAATNALNLGKEMAITGASQALRDSRYSIALFDGSFSGGDVMRDRLRTGVQKIDNNILLSTVSGIEIEFIDAKIDVNKKSVIKNTPLIGRNGDVKEYINQSDYTIKISGNLYAGNMYEEGYNIKNHNKDSKRFPYEELSMLNYILNENRSLKISAQYLNIFDVNQVVFKAADFNQSNMKYFNVMPFTLSFESDNDYEFLIKED